MKPVSLEEVDNKSYVTIDCIRVKYKRKQQSDGD